MKEIILVGGGGHCKSVIDVIEQEAKYKIAGIIDKKELIGSNVLGYKIIGCDDDLVKLKEKFSTLISKFNSLAKENGFDFYIC